MFKNGHMYDTYLSDREERFITDWVRKIVDIEFMN